MSTPLGGFGSLRRPFRWKFSAARCDLDHLRGWAMAIHRTKIDKDGIIMEMDTLVDKGTIMVDVDGLKSIKNIPWFSIQKCVLYYGI